ncbi:MAG TPA: AAA family ATPase [Streptosporangiaceae bacterium]|nr:AAA family ATPase [Streptosporangiaceae bacterium]
MAPEGPLGRDRELDEVEAFLDDVPAGLSALALTGPAGIGKTTVWREGVRRAVSRGYLVLSARPGQAEQALSFAGLADLLGPVGQEAFDSLVPVQRHALDVALLRADPGARPAGRAVPAALLSVLQSLAAVQPVLVAVDDAQWLDDATGESLPFALRRLERVPVGVLVSVRTDGQRPPTFDTTLPDERRHEVPVGPLTVAALHGVLKAQLRSSLPRPTLVRIAVSCGGNPFYALEVAREIERVGVPAPGEPLPVPGGLQALVRSRMARLPARTRQALLVAACQSQPTTETVDIEAIGPAEEAGIIRVERNGRLRFGHPLLAAAVQDSASAARKRAVHRQIAELTSDLEERARHLAAAATGPDEAVAVALDAAAKRAWERGALNADLARQAVEMTEDHMSDQAMERVIRFSEHCILSSGDPAEAKAMLESALRLCRPGDLRAELQLRLSWTVRGVSRSGEGYRDLLKAFGETTDPKLTARIHLQAIWMAEADPVHGLKHCDAALGLLDEDDDPVTYSSLVLHRAYLQLLNGQGADDAAIQRGQAIEDRAVEAGLDDRSPVPVIWPLLCDEFALAVDVHIRHLEWARQHGQQPLEQSLAYFLALLELWRGNWGRAGEWVAALAEMVEQSGSNYYWSNVLVTRGALDAHVGRLDRAADAAGQALAIAVATDEAREAEARQLLGFIALSRRDLAGAARELSAADEILACLGQREPALYRFHADLIEALSGLGDLDRAQEQADRLTERGRVFPRPSTLAMAARSHGLLLAARGDIDGSANAMREALTHHEHLEMPFERGRTLLAYGQVLRRKKERREARAVLAEALAVFEALGAPLWVERAREELKRVPVRRAPSGLTATEEEIARLAASGLTNLEIADRAFVSPKTVEANLSRVYDKLGIRSRTQLVLVLSQREQQTGPDAVGVRGPERA